MKIKTIVDEDFVNYKEPVMYIGTAYCDGKCCREWGMPLSVCQNDGWRASATVDIDDHAIVRRYLSNPITKAVCFAGLEPFEQFDEMYRLIHLLRHDYHCSDTVVIYTGYNPDEVADGVQKLRTFENIVIKFGRYQPGFTPHYDDVLGVKLASDNQFALQIS